MAHERKFRFGVQFSRAASGADWREKLRKAEDLGYSSVFMPDHFGDQLAPVPALAIAAEVTGLRIGALVLGNDYRHPVMVAKEAATIDLLSDGRLEMGLGAGWMKEDYVVAGLPYDPPRVRVERLEEAIAVIKGAFGPGPFSFAGRHYEVSDLDGRPKPVQRPHPPFLVGGGGPKVLGLAGREADIVGINFNLAAGEIHAGLGADGTGQATARKVDWVRAGAGGRFDELELNVLVFFAMVTDTRREQAETVGGMFGLTPEQALEVPHALVGTVGQICDDLVARRERFHISYIVVSEAAFEELAPVVGRLAGK